MRLKLSKKRCEDVAWEIKNKTARAKRCPETHVFESRQLKPVRRGDHQETAGGAGLYLGGYSQERRKKSMQNKDRNRAGVG